MRRRSFLCAAAVFVVGVGVIGAPQSVADVAPGGLSPADIAAAYNLPRDANGISDGGAGTTVALVEAGDSVNAESDMAQFRQQYGLPACTSATGCFRKINQRDDNVESGTISSGLDQGQCVDVYGGQGDNDKQLDLYQCIPGVWQWFRFAGDGTIRSNANPWQRLNPNNGQVGMCVDARAGGTTDGTAVVINDCDGAASQQWTYQNGTLVNTNSALCLNAVGGVSANTTPLELRDCTNAAGEQWTTNFNSIYPQPSGGNVSNGSDIEWSLDVDAVSAACPKCHILMVEADDFSLDSLGTAINEAASLGAKYISNSWGYYEDGLTPAIVQSFDADYLNHPGVLMAFDTGDDGYDNNNVNPPQQSPNYPASSPYALGVGGTTLTRDPNVPRGWTETAWPSSGSGCSTLEKAPAWQHVPACNGMKATADISAVADPSDFSIYNSDTNPNSPWQMIGGTSLATPLVTAMYAIAGGAGGNVSPPEFPYEHDLLLNNILDDSNGNCGAPLCDAGQGWNGPTGLGTPRSLSALTGRVATGNLVSGDGNDCVHGNWNNNGSQLTVVSPCNPNDGGQLWTEFGGNTFSNTNDFLGNSSTLQIQGKCMDTQSGNVTDGIPVVLELCSSGATSQQWKRGPYLGSLQSANAAAGDLHGCIDKSADGTELQLNTCATSDATTHVAVASQQWSLAG